MKALCDRFHLRHVRIVGRKCHRNVARGGMESGTHVTVIDAVAVCVLARPEGSRTLLRHSVSTSSQIFHSEG